MIVNERVRKMTPLECFRLMGFTDEDFFKVQKALNETFYKGRDSEYPVVQNSREFNHCSDARISVLSDVR